MTDPALPDDESDATDPVEIVDDGQPTGLGGLDLGSLLGAAQSMQAQMVESQQRIGATVVEGQSGGGAVTIAVTGGFEFQRVTISPDAVDPDDHSMLEDLVLAALRDAATKVAGLQAEANPLAGLGDSLGGLGGLFGGA